MTSGLVPFGIRGRRMAKRKKAPDPFGDRVLMKPTRIYAGLKPCNIFCNGTPVAVFDIKGYPFTFGQHLEPGHIY